MFQSSLCTGNVKKEEDQKMGLEDFMFSLAERPVEDQFKISDAEKQYTQLFGHAVPREMIPPAVTVEMLERAMKTCVESGKDELLQILGVQTDENNLY